MRHFAFHAPLALRGRKSRGLAGLSGKPLHPPLTDIPVAAYLFTAAFDLLSRLLRDGHVEVAGQLHLAATWVLLGGASVSLLTAVTGLADWATSKPGTQARRTANAHAAVMVLVTMLVLGDLAWRLGDGAAATTGALAVVSLLIGVLVFLGAAIGGAMVFGYGWSVASKSGAAAWEVSEADVLPGGRRIHEPAATRPEGGGRS